MKPKPDLPIVLPDDGDFAVDVDLDEELPSVGVRGDLGRDPRRDPTPLSVAMPPRQTRPAPANLPPTARPAIESAPTRPLAAPGARAPSSAPAKPPSVPPAGPVASPPAPPARTPSGPTATLPPGPFRPQTGPMSAITQPNAPHAPTGPLTPLPSASHRVDRSVALQGVVRVRGGGMDRMISNGAARLSPSSLYLPMERPLEIGTSVDVEARTPAGILRFEGVVLNHVERDAHTDRHGGVEVSVAPADAYTRRYLQQLAGGGGPGAGSGSGSGAS